MSSLIVSGERAVALTEVQINAARAATGLARLGVGAGDALALILRNDIAVFEATAAAGLLGAYAVPLNFHLTADEAGYILRDCGARVLVVHADLLPAIERAIPSATTVLVVETPAELAAAYGLADGATHVPADWISWACWLQDFDPLPPGSVPAPGAMIYTSGTTGRPKGVRRTPRNEAELAALYAPITIAFGLRPGMRSIIPAPLYHSAPNAYAVLATRIGSEKIVLMPRFRPEELLRLIEAHRITHVQLVPTMFVRLLKLPRAVRDQYDISSLEFVVHAAAPCAPQTKHAMIDWWGPIIHEYYGATEIGAVVYCNSAEWMAHPGTVGRALPGVEVRVLDEDGAECPAGVVGEVHARIVGATDFTYHGDDAKRRNAERGGLISVGDIGFLDADGFLHLCDRRADMVICGGVNIYPAEIEGVLVQLPEVADCAVFGIPDDELGETLCACVQLIPDVMPDEASICIGLRQKLTGYKVPRKIVFMDRLPREDSGKIFKRKLREPYWEGRQRRI